MSITAAVVIAVVELIFVWALLIGGNLPSPYRSRVCQGKSWRHAFPGATKTEIRRFLACFTHAFAFSDNEKLKFSPHDQLLDIYRALYPHTWQADAMEFETLCDEVQKTYGVDLSHIWRQDMRLGQLFAYVGQSAK